LIKTKNFIERACLFVPTAHSIALLHLVGSSHNLMALQLHSFSLYSFTLNLQKWKKVQLLLGLHVGAKQNRMIHTGDEVYK
jgi:hypothetical protein